MQGTPSQTALTGEINMMLRQLEGLWLRLSYPAYLTMKPGPFGGFPEARPKHSQDSKLFSPMLRVHLSTKMLTYRKKPQRMPVLVT